MGLSPMKLMLNHEDCRFLDFLHQYLFHCQSVSTYLGQDVESTAIDLVAICAANCFKHVGSFFCEDIGKTFPIRADIVPEPAGINH